MSEQEFRIEKCGGLTVYHPIKKQAEVIVYLPWFTKEWDAIVERKAA